MDDKGGMNLHQTTTGLPFDWYQAGFYFDHKTGEILSAEESFCVYQDSCASELFYLAGAQRREVVRVQPWELPLWPTDGATFR